MRNLLEDAASRAIAYREGIEQRQVAATSKAISDLDAFREQMPQQGTSESDTLALLDQLKLTHS